MTSFTSPCNHLALSLHQSLSVCPCSSLHYANSSFSPAHFPSSFSSDTPPFHVTFSILPLLVRSYELSSPPCLRREEHTQSLVGRRGRWEESHPDTALCCFHSRVCFLQTYFIIFFSCLYREGSNRSLMELPNHRHKKNKQTNKKKPQSIIFWQKANKCICFPSNL